MILRKFFSRNSRAIGPKTRTNKTNIFLIPNKNYVLSVRIKYKSTKYL